MLWLRGVPFGLLAPLWSRLTQLFYGLPSFCTDVHGPQRINSTDFVNHLQPEHLFFAVRWEKLTLKHVNYIFNFVPSLSESRPSIGLSCFHSGCAFDCDYECGLSGCLIIYALNHGVLPGIFPGDVLNPKDHNQFLRPELKLQLHVSFQFDFLEAQEWDLTKKAFGSEKPDVDVIQFTFNTVCKETTHNAHSSTTMLSTQWDTLCYRKARYGCRAPKDTTLMRTQWECYVLLLYIKKWASPSKS